MCINTTMYIINRNSELSSIKYVTFGNINNIECIPFGITLYLNRLSLLCVFPDTVEPTVSNHPKCDTGGISSQESNHRGSLPRRGPETST